jgi:hypothetical protein
VKIVFHCGLRAPRYPICEHQRSDLLPLFLPLRVSSGYVYCSWPGIVPLLRTPFYPSWFGSSARDDFFTSDVPGSMVTVCSVRFSSTTVRILHTPEVLLEFIKGGTCPMVWDHLFFVSYIVFLRLDICYIYIYIVKHYMSKKIYNFKLEI